MQEWDCQEAALFLGDARQMFRAAERPGPERRATEGRLEAGEVAAKENADVCRSSVSTFKRENGTVRGQCAPSITLVSSVNANNCTVQKAT